MLAVLCRHRWLLESNFRRHLLVVGQPSSSAASSRHFSSSSADTRPFRILGVQQIAIGSPDRQALRHLWCDILGLEITASHRLERENVEEDIVRLNNNNGVEVEIDLMTPIDPEASPKVHVPPLNHIGVSESDCLL